MKPGDTLSSFLTQWEFNWNKKELRGAYVIVRGGRIGQHFLAYQKTIADGSAKNK